MPKNRKNGSVRSAACLAYKAAHDARDALDEHIVVSWHEAQAYAHRRVSETFPRIITLAQRIRAKIKHPEIRKRLNHKDWKAIALQFQSLESLCLWCHEADCSGTLEDFLMDAEKEMRKLADLHERLCRHLLQCKNT